MLQNNSAEEMKDATKELLFEMMLKNNVDNSDLISIILTATVDLNCAFPAAAAREMGMGDVPLLCSVEMNVVGAPEKVVRVLMHCETDLKRSEITHIYLRGAEVLRQDLAQ
ncbi:MAG: chorismate mutase [Candidatus Nanopelagicales bacterium]